MNKRLPHPRFSRHLPLAVAAAFIMSIIMPSCGTLRTYGGIEHDSEYYFGDDSHHHHRKHHKKSHKKHKKHKKHHHRHHDHDDDDD